MISIPTLQDNIDEALDFLTASMGQDSAINDKAFLMVLSRLQGIIKTSLYQFSAEQLKSVFAITANIDALEAIGLQYDVIRKLTQPTALSIRVTGDTGATIPITTTWNCENNDMKYFQNSEYTVGVTGEVLVEVTAQAAGLSGNLRNNTVLTSGATIDGVASNATVASTVALGSDDEPVDDYRARVLDELRTVGGGSNAADIRRWGQEAANVKRVYPYTGDLTGGFEIVTPGKRTVFVESTPEYNADGIADQPLLDAVRQSITTDPNTLKSRQALGSTDDTLIIQSVVREGFTLKLWNLQVAPSEEYDCKEDISIAVDKFLRDFSVFIDGLDPKGFKNHIITSVAVADVVQDVVGSYSGSVDRIEVFKDSSAGGSIGFYELSPGELAKGAVEYG